MDKTLEIIIIMLLIGIIAELYILAKPKKRYSIGQVSMLVDTSVLMDGRVVDLAKTGFLLGQVVVPKSVLAELQLLADGSDHTKRERARMGMDVVKSLQDILGGSFKLLQDEADKSRGVDEQLLLLAKQTDSAILTLDYNLNKVAQVEGVQVLNINELAKSLRMTHLPGDTLTIDLTQKGQNSDQAVGHLPDGTMVVVEQAKKYIGQSKEVEIIRSLQTDAGKMMFAKVVASAKESHNHNQDNKKTQNVRQVQGSVRRKVHKKVSDDGSTPKPKHKVAAKPSRGQRTSAQREDDLIKLVEKQ